MQERPRFQFGSWSCAWCRKNWKLQLALEVKTSIFILQEDLDKMWPCKIANSINAFQEGTWTSQSNLQPVSSDLLTFPAPEMRVPADMKASEDGAGGRLCKRLPLNLELKLLKMVPQVLVLKVNTAIGQGNPQLRWHKWLAVTPGPFCSFSPRSSKARWAQPGQLLTMHGCNYRQTKLREWNRHRPQLYHERLLIL